MFQYADDTVLVLQCLEILEVRLCRCLFIVSIILGLQVNHHKSYLIRVDKDPVEVQIIASVLGY